jgi:sRNA-binding carbon storage regulator CsrA
MLKLTRKVGEKIYIFPKEGTEQMTVEEFFAGGQICIELSKLRGTQASIGVDATENLDIVREELG